MMTKHLRLTSVLACAALVAACGQSAAPTSRADVGLGNGGSGTGSPNLVWPQYDRPADYTATTGPDDTDVPITMSDGVILRANVRRPDVPGRYPVIVELTPYNKNGAVAQAYDYLVARGYIQVTVDVRGTGSSQGTWDSFGPSEQRDGYEIVEWAAQQPWSDGNVGMIGPSYMGLTQILTAGLKPPHLKAIFPIVPMADSYRDITMSGGQTNMAFIPLWLGLVTGTSLVPAQYPSSGSPQDLVLAFTTLLSHASGIVGFQTNTVLNTIAGGDLAYDGPFWKTRSPIELDDDIQVPAFIVGGTHDLFQRGEPMHYERLRHRVTTKLLVGPWTHVDASSGTATTGTVGLPRDGVPDYSHIALQWFDQYLKGMDVHADALPPVTYWNYGHDRFETQADWPLPTLAPTKYYLRGTDATSGHLGGSLDTSPATADEGSDTWLQQPVSGICTQSTGQWTAGAGEPIPCDTHDEVNEAAEVKFSTGPLDHELSFQGPIVAHLWLSTTAADAVVSVRLTDVDPATGQSKELTDGWLAASFRAVDPAKSRFVRGELLQPWHPFTRDSVLEVPSGVPFEMDVEVFPTNASLQPGHELRVAIGPSDFPHAVPPLPQLANALGGVVTLYRDAQHASYVTLPIIGADCAQPGCAPLPVPDMVRH